MEDATKARKKPQILTKASSFSAGRSEKPREIDRKLSLGPIKLRHSHDFDHFAAKNAEEEPEPTLVTIADVIDGLIGFLLAVEDPPEIPVSTVERFLFLLEDEVTKFDNGDEKWPADVGDELELFDAIGRLSRLSSALAKFASVPSFRKVVNRAGCLLHHSMCVLEDEFFALFLQDSKTGKQDGPVTSNSKVRVMPSFQLPSFRQSEPERSTQPASAPPESHSAEHNMPVPVETCERMRRIAASMISAGYEIECCQLFAVGRRNAFEAALPAFGYEKTSMEDVLKMTWENLENDITSWIKAFRHIMTDALAAEHELCLAVFASHRAIADRLFRSFANCVIIQLLTFAEAVSMMKRSAEKLFKVLDVYEVLRDVTPAIEALLPDSEEQELSVLSDPKTEISSVKTRLGEAAVAIFCELEGSIKTDTNKTPVPGGAVHPLTRYTMNYLKYACCEYGGTLEELFKEHRHPDCDEKREGDNGGERSLFGERLVEAMDQLHLNLEVKSKLYKDLALCNIFLMNNGRYVAMKVKGTPAIHQLAGETWYRRRSSDLRQYHKNYQRETWSKLLACLRDDGLHVKAGTVSKPLLKDRLKSFNSLFEEIHKMQSSWVVSDEQLQSELRVSVSAVVVPAYRSFVGRFSQYLDPGRQTEKYIKFAPEDLESLIDELFDGNPSANASKRRP